jgi:hypothetical protein
MNTVTKDVPFLKDVEAVKRKKFNSNRLLWETFSSRIRI